MTVGFVDFAYFHNRDNVGSSKIRSRWVSKYWSEAETFSDGKKYDVEIYQKCYWTGHMKHSPALKILDVCDPDWLENPKFAETFPYVHGITVPTEAFARHFARVTDLPVKVIPDRLDLDLFKIQKTHVGKAKRVVWFGYSHNMGVLTQAIHTVKRLGLKLTVISEDMRMYLKDSEDSSVFEFVKYEEKTINQDIRKYGDIALFPPHMVFDTGRVPYRAQFKSNNKTIQAWANGLPVATNSEELEFFLDPDHRNQEAKDRLAEVKDKYDVKLSVQEYKDFIESLMGNFDIVPVHSGKIFGVDAHYPV